MLNTVTITTRSGRIRTYTPKGRDIYSLDRKGRSRRTSTISSSSRTSSVSSIGRRGRRGSRRGGNLIVIS